MLLLLGFAFLSGLITIAAPCIWPLLPIVLSTSTTGGHRKPIGVTLGIITSFALFTLTLSYIVKIIPINLDALRFLAVIVIGFLGLTLLIPKLSSIVEGWVSKLSGRAAMTTNPGTGFTSGFLTGFTLGIVWSPCAGPILATIATLAATRAVSFEIVLVTVAYVTGIGIPLFLFALIGRRFFAKSRALSPYTGRIQQVFGVIMILTAIGIATGYDKVIQAKLLDSFPSYSNTLNIFEGNQAVKDQLAILKGQKNGLDATSNSSDLLSNYGKAPEFTGITHWLNTDKPLTLADLKGKVVLIDFWTYTCINCIRTLPHVTSWYEKYKDKGFIVIGVHTPEFEFEKNTDNVQNAIGQFGIHYPVAQDNDFGTWNAYSNQYWPAEYLIDAKGVIRRTHFGEGEYEENEQAIQALLKEAGQKITEKTVSLPDETPKTKMSTETYLGAARMDYYVPNGSIPSGKYTLDLSKNISENTFTLGGEWTIGDKYSMTGKNAVLEYNFIAGNVYLVMRPGSNRQAKVKVYLDGKVVDAVNAGEDVKNGIVTVDSDRLYRLIKNENTDGPHLLRLEFQNVGTEVYAFTFG